MEIKGELTIGTIVGWIILAAVAFPLWGCPQYKVYYAGKAGEAELRQASFNRQIKVQEAQAAAEAAKSLAEAEVIRASGVAKANAIIGDSLRNNEDYLRYLWIHNLESGSNSVIYVPTEAGLPILEAGKRQSATKP